ncbi:hypothetical protein BC629DRAFT_1036321 [Irpex lacteus]|nr:hypothetical protein BC629DRAFT_1036321 [Irpex lacteus]
MSSDTAYPTLTSWAKTTLTYLFEADPHNFDDSIVKYLAKDVEFVVINGKQLTKEEYVTRLHASRGTFKTAKVEFLHAVEVQDQEGSEKAGAVSVFFTAHIVENEEIDGQPITETATASFHLKIKEDTTLEPPPGGGHFDPRRVVALNTVYTRVRHLPSTHQT